MRATVEDSPKGVSLAHSPVPSSVTSSSTFSSPSWMWQLLGLFLLVVVTSATRPPWVAPGCHLVGHTRTVDIPGCVSFEVTTNACRGYCLSYATPSYSGAIDANPYKVITSRSQCCNIVDTQDVHVNVRCQDGFQRKTFKSARSCSCSICRSG